METSSIQGRRWILSITAACLVLGGLLGVQAHTQRLRGATEVGRRTSALIERLTASEDQLDKQREEIERLRTRLTEYGEEAASERGLVRLMTEELSNARIALGISPVQGPGIELELADSTMPAGDEFGDQDVFVVHDFDLLHITNELWAAGAEAIALNGQRLVSGSAITCSTRLIKVDEVTISSPFTFLAIGDPDNLASALNIRDGVLDRLQVLQFQVKLTPREQVLIPPVAVGRQYELARPAQKEEGE
jgi:uncharacterized protein YlxW (UPF0749 family)